MLYLPPINSLYFPQCHPKSLIPLPVNFSFAKFTCSRTAAPRERYLSYYTYSCHTTGFPVILQVFLSYVPFFCHCHFITAPLSPFYILCTPSHLTPHNSMVYYFTIWMNLFTLLLRTLTFTPLNTAYHPCMQTHLGMRILSHSYSAHSPSTHKHRSPFILDTQIIFYGNDTSDSLATGR